MKNLLRKLFALLGIDITPTVAKATASLKKAVTDLEATVEHHTAAAVAHSSIAQAALHAKAKAEAEVDKAKTVITNVKALFGE